MFSKKENILINGKEYKIRETISLGNTIYRVSFEGKNFVAKKFFNGDNYHNELEIYFHLQRGGKESKYVTKLLEYDEEKRIFLFEEHFKDINELDFGRNLRILLVLMHDIGMAIKFIHESNITHQDIKASNILYNIEENKYLLTDFDIGGYEDDHIFLSTIYVASPETLMKWKENATLEQLKKTDLFSFGATLYSIYNKIIGTYDYINFSPYKDEKYNEIDNRYYQNEIDSITILPTDINTVKPVNDKDEMEIAICKVINSLLSFDPENRMSIQEIFDTIFPFYVKMKGKDDRTDYDFFYGID